MAFWRLVSVAQCSSEDEIFSGANKNRELFKLFKRELLGFTSNSWVAENGKLKGFQMVYLQPLAFIPVSQGGHFF